MRFPPAGWAWPPGPRVAAAHNSGVDGRRDGREKGPMQATSGPQRDKTLPARPARRPTRYKTLPASPKTPISAHFSHAGRTLYRFRHQQPEQGELYPACGATSGTKLSQQAALAGPPGTKLSQRARLGGPPGTKLSQQAALAGPPGTKLSQRAPKRRFRPTFRMQGELFTASATNTTSTEKKVTHQHPTSCIMPRSAHITGTIHGLRTLSGHIPAGTSINARCRHSNDSPATRLRPTQNPHHRVREGHQRPHLSSTSESPV